MLIRHRCKPTPNWNGMRSVDMADALHPQTLVNLRHE